MNDTRNARERLDALLNGLEDEVIGGEGDVTSDVAAMRAQMEALIEAHADGGRAERSSKSRDVKGKVASAMGLLTRWAGIGQGGARRTAMPRVRMAFSGEREEAEGGGSPLTRSRRDRTKSENEGDAS